jgi:tetratricopeptide (TPR) repeat protein
MKYSYRQYGTSSGLPGVELVIDEGVADAAVFRFLGMTAGVLEPFCFEAAVEKWINWDKTDGTSHNLQAAIMNVIWALDREGQTDRALSYVLRMLPFSLDYVELSFMCIDIGKYLKKNRRYSDAEACFRECLERRPTDPRIQYALHNNMGFCLCMMDQSVDAEQFCREAIRLNPDEYHAHKNLGAALMGQMRIVEAAESLLGMIEVSRGDEGAVEAAEGFLSRIPQLTAEAPEIVGKIRDLIRKAKADVQGVKTRETAGAK